MVCHRSHRTHLVRGFWEVVPNGVGGALGRRNILPGSQVPLPRCHPHLLDVPATRVHVVSMQAHTIKQVKECSRVSQHPVQQSYWGDSIWSSCVLADSGTSATALLHIDETQCCDATCKDGRRAAATHQMSRAALNVRLSKGAMRWAVAIRAAAFLSRLSISSGVSCSEQGASSAA